MKQLKCPSCGHTWSPAPRAKAESEVRLNLKARQFEGIDDARLKAWVESYPAVDVPLEIKKLAQWACDNPTQRKSSWARFLTNNLSKSQDKARPWAAVPGGPVPAKGNGLRRSEFWDSWHGVVAMAAVTDVAPFKATEDTGRSYLWKVADAALAAGKITQMDVEQLKLEKPRDGSGAS